jgi:glycosyltransferase involved in cell wall biosynthesis
MAVHNAGKYIRQAIDSALRQTLADFELIVIDDASTDGSLQMVQVYSDPRIHIIENSVQKGPSYSRNKGLERARGDYIAILDADDIALSDRLRIQSDYLDATPDVSLVGSSSETIDQEGNILGQDRVRRDPLTLRWLLLFGNCFVHSTVMFRRDAVESGGGYDEAMPPAEDYDLYVRLAAHGTVALLEDVLCQWRDHPESLSRQQSVKTQKPVWVHSICRSVYLQTAQRIDEDLAVCLMRNGSRPAKNRHTVRKAFAVIINCFESLSKSHSTRAECRTLLLLAIEELLRVAKLNPGSMASAFHDVARLLRRRDPLVAFQPALIKIMFRALLPSRLTTSISHLRRRNRVSSTSAASLAN